MGAQRRPTLSPMLPGKEVLRPARFLDALLGSLGFAWALLGSGFSWAAKGSQALLVSLGLSRIAMESERQFRAPSGSETHPC